MDLSAIEKEIVARLKTTITPSNEHLVRAFPNDLEEIRKLHPKGGILVRYLGSENTNPEPNQQKISVQDETQNWQILIVNRNLNLERPHDGVYELVKLVKEKLTGFTPASAIESTIMYPIRDRFITHNLGMWVHEVIFNLVGSHVEC